MAFTSIELVRTHLAGMQLGETDVRDIRLILNGTAPSALPHSGLVANTITIKAQRSLSPERESRALADGWVVLNHAQLIPGTVLTASDSSLGTVYIENVDFIVDAGGGRIKRLGSGAIEYAQTVCIWYAFYHVYAEGDDFAFNAALGQVTRRSSGLIADGQEVLVDYAVSHAAISDQVIEQAINESGESVLRLIADSYHEDPAPGIVIGATHCAVAQVARMCAAASLADTAFTLANSRSAAQTWLDIATRYEQTGREFLSRYSNPVVGRPSLKRG